MTERDRQRAIQLKLARSEAKRVRRIPTGFSALDQALDGGLPRGLITELSGAPSSGKTTVALCMAAHTQQNSMRAAWIDAEHVFDPATRRTWGSVSNGWRWRERTRPRNLSKSPASLPGQGVIDFLVLDSAAALTPAIECEIGIGEIGPGLQARVLATGFRRLAVVAAKTETAVLVLNQIRSAGGAGSSETSAGGPAVKLHAALRIALEPLETGLGAHFRILKSRLAAVSAKAACASKLHVTPPRPCKMALFVQSMQKNLGKSAFFCCLHSNVTL